MINSVNVINEIGQYVKIDVIMAFKIEKYNKDYIVYTVNDDGKSEDVYMCIAGIQEINGKKHLRLIPEEEKNMVLVFYDNLRDNICGIR